MPERVFWGLRTFCVITGASRGIGQEIAYQFSKRFRSGSLIVLLSRKESGLQKTKSRIVSNVPGINVKVVSIDLSEPDNETYHKLLTNVLEEHNVKACDFEHAMIVHNAAGVPDMTKLNPFSSMKVMDDINTIQEYLKMNVTAPMVLTVQFLKIFKQDIVQKRTVLQTSSIASQMPGEGTGLYSMSKSARNMYFQTLAVEDPSLDVFSYGPGPVDTEMFRGLEAIYGKETVDNLVSSGLVLTCEKTVNWFVNMLTKGSYNSGEFKDIYKPEQYQKLFEGLQLQQEIAQG